MADVGVLFSKCYAFELGDSVLDNLFLFRNLGGRGPYHI